MSYPFPKTRYRNCLRNGHGSTSFALFISILAILTGTDFNLTFLKVDFIAIVLGILLLLLLITVFKLDTFISFMLVCLFVGVFEGLSIVETMKAIQDGIGNTRGSIVIILGFGTMLGKLVAESVAANEITNQLVSKFGIKLMLRLLTDIKSHP
jgi:predicted histidine transporter YuiF (NhaC family)